MTEDECLDELVLLISMRPAVSRAALTAAFWLGTTARIPDRIVLTVLDEVMFHFTGDTKPYYMHFSQKGKITRGRLGSKLDDEETV